MENSVAASTALSSNAAAYAMLIAGLSVVVLAIAFIVWYVAQMVANWKLFKKAGEKGWKSIIPVYNIFTSYKIAWKPVWFWIYLVVNFAYLSFDSLAGAVSNSQTAATVLLAIAALLAIASFVIWVMYNNKLAKAFGHGAGFTIGLIFLNPLFILILGFGRSEYVGADQ